MLSKISRVLVSAFDTFVAGGGDLCEIDYDIAQDTGLIPVLAHICSILLRIDYETHQCFACLLDFSALVRMIDPIVAHFWHSDTKWRKQGPPSARMLLDQLLSYVTEVTVASWMNIKQC